MSISIKTKMEIWVSIGTIGVLISAFEVIGLDKNIPWSHTISYYSQHYRALFLVILAVFIALPVWWVWHILFTHIPKLIRRIHA